MTEQTPAGDGDARSSERRSARRQAHPLLAPFPITVMAIATFLVVFAVMMASLRSQAGTGLPVSNTAALSEGRHVVVRTTASGRVIAAGPATAEQAPASASAPTVVTGASGAGERDD